jgi:uncharacterized protein with GYD domain
MPLYLTQFTYSSEAWKALAQNPQDRSEPVRTLLQKLGGKLHNFYYSLGEYDGVVIFEAPDDVTATAFEIAAHSPGHLKTTKTTRLLTVAQAIEAMRKAGGVDFTGPSSPSLTGYFVSPTGLASNSGSITSPWSLAHAISGANGRIRPGDTVWIRGGTYGTSASFQWHVTVGGTSTAPVIFRAYNPTGQPGDVEDARINGEIQVEAQHTWVWGLHHITTSAEPLPQFNSVVMRANNCKAINCFSDQAGPFIGLDGEVGSEWYGNIVRIGPKARPDFLHPYYIQNSSTTVRKYVRECMALDAPLEGSAGFHSYTATPALRNITYENCIALECHQGYLFSNGGSGEGGTGLELLGCQGCSRAGAVAQLGNVTSDGRLHQDVTVRDCYLGISTGGSHDCVRLWDWDTVELTGNRIWGGRTCINAQKSDVAAFPAAWNIENNIYDWWNLSIGPFTTVLSGAGNARVSFASWQSTHGFDRTGSLTGHAANGEPTVNRVFVGQNNVFEPGRANVVCWNHTNVSTMAIPAAEVSRVLSNGDAYEVRDARNFWGRPVASGTWASGAGITVPVNRTLGPGNPFVLVRM